MAELKKKSTSALFTHWARPRVRTYEYNFEYGEAYYRPMVKYISTSRVMSSSSSSSSFNYETRRAQYERRRRAGSPPGPLSFIERWSYEPFYGYGVGFRSRQSVERSLQSASAASNESSATNTSRAASDFYNSFSRSLRASSVAAVDRQSSMQQSQSTNINVRSSRARSVETSANINMRSSRARSVEAVASSSCAAGYASDDCLMRSNALDCAASALAKSRDILNTSSLTKRTLVMDDRNVLHGKTLDERYYIDYPKQHLVCPPNCPLHNNPEWRRRFLIGNRFLDAAALGGFDVLYDPNVYSSSRRLLAKLAERNESESEEILIQRESSVESSRRRIRASASVA